MSATMHGRRRFLKAAGLGSLAVVCGRGVVGAPSVKSPPNVVLIMTDDQGYGDLACHGNKYINTPQMDRLGRQAVRFTDFHVDPTCSPTRGALMTGKYSHRVKVWHTIAGGNHLRASETTMADVFKASGYRTGMFGKWHLGSNYPYRPMDRGFDEWLGQGDGGTGTLDDYFTNDRVNDHYHHNGKWEYRKGYAPDVFFGAAIDFIKDRRSRKPFFIYLNTYIPHSIHTVPDKAWAKKYVPDVGQRVAYFYAGIERVDRNIGMLRAALTAEGLADNTILIFMTDNGSIAGVKVFNAGMRGRKGTVYEGGHRVPFFIRWPAGKLKHGSDVADMNAHIDILPTLIDLCGLKAPKDVDFDGRSFKPQLFEPDKLLPDRMLCVEFQRTFKSIKWKRAVAMSRRWRLVNATELYDIDKDPGQQTNVIKDHPEVVERLKKAFDAYWRRVTPNDRDRAKFIVGHPSDPETYLQSGDWYLSYVPWNHQHASSGVARCGTWLIAAATEGAYEFEVRRWAKEVDAPISGVPKLKKTVDAWSAHGSKPYLIYAGEKSPFKALPVASIRLTVGKYKSVKKVKPADTKITFTVPLDSSDHEVRAEMLDAQQKLIAGAYYVYCRKKT
jgi:arylsulfatase A-like enzyme